MEDWLLYCWIESVQGKVCCGIGRNLYGRRQELCLVEEWGGIGGICSA
jgi:hypothetical protein